MGKKSSTKKMNIQYSSHLTDIVDLNESFDKGIMRIAYSGLNRNNSFISRQTFEKCIKTLAYVPVVSNYNISTKQIGGHDSEYQEDEDGEIQEYVITTPLGVVPADFNWFWEEVTEQDGKIHSYICSEILLWKRQPVYEYVKKNGITDQSMEISVNSGDFDNGYYNITDFTFTALTLLGTSIEPCFESASLHTYSTNDFKTQYSEMFEDFKLHFTNNQSSQLEVDINKNINEKGEMNLNKRLELIELYGFTVEALDFNYEDFELEELTAKLEAFKKSLEPSVEPVTEPDGTDDFALSSQFGESLYEAISIEKIETEYGMYSKYSMVDYDSETSEVYAYDREDYKLYGFTYSVSGDVVSVDFDSKKKKKFAIVDFNESEDTKEFSLEAYTREIVESAIATATKNTEEQFSNEKIDLEVKVSEFEAIKEEYTSLQEFKTQYEDSQKEAIFNSEVYAVLADSKEFAELKANAKNYSLVEIVKECKVIFADYVISVSEFSLEEEAKVNKLNIPMNQSEVKKPYGGYFDKYVTPKTKN